MGRERTNERSTELKEGRKPGTGQARDVRHLPVFGTPDSALTHVVPQASLRRAQA